MACTVGDRYYLGNEPEKEVGLPFLGLELETNMM
jgi:hypothetical protein